MGFTATASEPKIKPGRKPGRWLLPGVELFVTGQHTDSAGETLNYAEGDLGEMAHNYALLRPLWVPPVGTGHDSPAGIKDLFGRDSALAEGEVTRTWTEDRKIDGKPVTILRADIEVDDQTAEWVRNGNLRQVSSEVDEDPPPEGVKKGAKGWTLKRVGLLGFQPPAQKGLAPLPMPVRFKEDGGKTHVFSETFKRATAHSFAETGTMDRAAMITELTAMGADPLWLDPLPEEFLAWLWDLVKPEEAPVDAPMPDVAMGDQGQGDRHPKSVSLKYAERMDRMEKVITNLRAQVAVDNRNGVSLAKAERRRQVHSFCEAKAKEGRLDPADMATDAAGLPLPGTVLSRLLRAADSPATRKFSEGGKAVERTELEMQMAEIDAKQPRKYSEKVGAGKAGVQGVDDSTRLDKIREEVKSRYPARVSAGNRVLSKLGMRVGANHR